MAQEICGKTKVTINGVSVICDNFPKIWELFKANNIQCSEKNKEIILRILFIEGRIDLNKYGVDVKMEIVWED